MKPTDAISGYNFDSTAGTISIPIATLGVTAAQANNTTGDFRVIYNALNRTLVTNIPGITPAVANFSVTETRTLVTGGRVEVNYTGKSSLIFNVGALSFPTT